MKLAVTMVTVAVTHLAAKLQPQEHEQTQQTTLISKIPEHLMVLTKQSGVSLHGSPAADQKASQKYRNRNSDHEQEVLIFVLC